MVCGDAVSNAFFGSIEGLSQIRRAADDRSGCLAFDCCAALRKSGEVGPGLGAAAIDLTDSDDSAAVADCDNLFSIADPDPAARVFPNRARQKSLSSELTVPLPSPSARRSL